MPWQPGKPDCSYLSYNGQLARILSKTTGLSRKKLSKIYDYRNKRTRRCRPPNHRRSGCKTRYIRSPGKIYLHKFLIGRDTRSGKRHPYLPPPSRIAAPNKRNCTCRETGKPGCDSFLVIDNGDGRVGRKDFYVIADYYGNVAGGFLGDRLIEFESRDDSFKTAKLPRLIRLAKRFKQQVKKFSSFSQLKRNMDNIVRRMK